MGDHKFIPNRSYRRVYRDPQRNFVQKIYAMPDPHLFFKTYISAKSELKFFSIDGCNEDEITSSEGIKECARGMPMKGLAIQLTRRHPGTREQCRQFFISIMRRLEGVLDRILEDTTPENNTPEPNKQAFILPETTVLELNIPTIPETLKLDVVYETALQEQPGYQEIRGEDTDPGYTDEEDNENLNELPLDNKTSTQINDVRAARKKRTSDKAIIANLNKTKFKIRRPVMMTNGYSLQRDSEVIDSFTKVIKRVHCDDCATHVELAMLHIDDTLSCSGCNEDRLGYLNPAHVFPRGGSKRKERKVPYLQPQRNTTSTIVDPTPSEAMIKEHLSNYGVENYTVLMSHTEKNTTDQKPKIVIGEPLPLEYNAFESMKPKACKFSQTTFVIPNVPEEAAIEDPVIGEKSEPISKIVEEPARDCASEILKMITEKPLPKQDPRNGLWSILPFLYKFKNSKNEACGHMRMSMLTGDNVMEIKKSDSTGSSGTIYMAINYETYPGCDFEPTQIIKNKIVNCFKHEMHEFTPRKPKRQRSWSDMGSTTSGSMSGFSRFSRKRDIQRSPEIDYRRRRLSPNTPAWEHAPSNLPSGLRVETSSDSIASGNFDHTTPIRPPIEHDGARQPSRTKLRISKRIAKLFK